MTFTDTSTDVDGTIASRAWDLDGDGAYDDATGAIAGRSYATAGPVTVGLRVTDDDGAGATTSRTLTVTEPTVPAPPPSTGGQNAVVNGSFEGGTTGWTTWQAGLTRVALAGAPEGSYVARVARTSGTSFTVDDAPTSVASATAGALYTGRAHVQAATASATGKQVRLYLRERSASGAILRTVASPAVTLGASFVPVSATLTAQAAGNQIEVYVGQAGAVSGDAFHMDAVFLGGGDAPAPPPAPANTAPTASFTAGTLVPPVGVGVTFTDTSTDVDGTIASRAWDLDGDGAYDDATGAIAVRSYATAGPVTVGLRVTDDDGAGATTSRTLTVTEPTVPAPPPSTGGQNAVVNGSFEGGTTGWTTWQAGLTRVALAGAPEGSYVARVARTSGTSFTVDDAPTSVASATAGALYTGRAHVQAATASATGKQVRLYLRERSASGAILRTVASPPVTLGAGFVPVSATLTAQAAGNQIEVYVGQAGAVSGDAFHMDAVTLSR